MCACVRDICVDDGGRTMCITSLLLCVRWRQRRTTRISLLSKCVPKPSHNLSFLSYLYRPGSASWIVAPNHRKMTLFVFIFDGEHPKDTQEQNTKFLLLLLYMPARLDRTVRHCVIESAMLEKGVTCIFFLCNHLLLFKDVASHTAHSRI